MILITPCILLLLAKFNPRATFKLRLLHYMILTIACTPFVLLQNHSLYLATSCLLISVTLLAYECPLMASVPFALAFNLELAKYGVLGPIFVAYAICTVIKNAGTGSTIV